MLHIGVGNLRTTPSVLNQSEYFRKRELTKIPVLLRNLNRIKSDPSYSKLKLQALAYFQGSRIVTIHDPIDS